MIQLIEYVGHRLNKVNYLVNDGLEELINSQNEPGESDTAVCDLYISDAFNITMERDYFIVSLKRNVSYNPKGLYDIEVVMEVMFGFDESKSQYITEHLISENIQHLMRMNHNILGELSLLIASISGAMAGHICISAPMIHTKNKDLEILTDRQRREMNLTH